MKTNKTIIDLTHSLNENIPTWDGERGFELSISCNYSDCTSPNTFKINKINMNAGIGTHIDAPAHMIEGSNNIDELKLSELITECIVIDISDKVTADYIINKKDIEEFEKENGIIPENSFVIFYTGWEKYWEEKEKYINNHKFPSLDTEVAEFLLNRKISGIGTDTLSVDTGENGFPVHLKILGAGKYLVENIKNANLLPKTGSQIFIAPIKIEGGTEAPVRLFAMF
ncbi:MAG: cyclase family protein [Candidatus Pacebacteria bacterium]|nr:cyclase family protein [Candidatus Paceibacterota bacterium]